MVAKKQDYTEIEKFQIWQKAMIVDGVDRNEFRQDYAGAWIRFSDYGNRDSQYGWEVDHLMPLSKGGEEVMSNYLPLQWRNNVRKGDDYPRWATAVTSDGKNNIEQEKYWKIKS